MRWKEALLGCLLVGFGFLLRGWSATPRSGWTKLPCSDRRWCEVPSEPQPRPDPRWQACHQQHVAAIEAADAEGQPGYGVLFLGDSITESWVGTDLCGPCARCQGVPDVFVRHYGKYNAGVAAVGGDQTAHLMWRLAHGELPSRHQPRVVVLMIGTNDLGAAAWEAGDAQAAEQATLQAVPGMTLRVLRTLRLLRDALPDAHIVLTALLPRGGNGPGARFFQWPSAFAQPLALANQHFKAYTDLDAHLHFLDCGDRFLAPGGRALDAALMPDALHPSAAGYELLAQCLDPTVARLMQRPPAAEAAQPAGNGSRAT